MNWQALAPALGTLAGGAAVGLAPATFGLSAATLPAIMAGGMGGGALGTIGGQLAPQGGMPPPAGAAPMAPKPQFKPPSLQQGLMGPTPGQNAVLKDRKSVV